MQRSCCSEGREIFLKFFFSDWDTYGTPSNRVESFFFLVRNFSFGSKKSKHYRKETKSLSRIPTKKKREQNETFLWDPKTCDEECYFQLDGSLVPSPFC
jgi:hypothetical protein